MASPPPIPCNWHTVIAVTATLIVATGCAVESTATAVSELLCGSIPIVIMHSLPSRDGINPATGTLTLLRWNNEGDRRELTALTGCSAEDSNEEPERCGLPSGHAGAHSFEYDRTD